MFCRCAGFSRYQDNRIHEEVFILSIRKCTRIHEDTRIDRRALVISCSPNPLCSWYSEIENTRQFPNDDWRESSSSLLSIRKYTRIHENTRIDRRALLISCSPNPLGSWYSEIENTRQFPNDDWRESSSSSLSIRKYTRIHEDTRIDRRALLISCSPNPLGSWYSEIENTRQFPNDDWRESSSSSLSIRKYTRIHEDTRIDRRALLISCSPNPLGSWYSEIENTRQFPNDDWRESSSSLLSIRKYTRIHEDTRIDRRALLISCSPNPLGSWCLEIENTRQFPTISELLLMGELF